MKLKKFGSTEQQVYDLAAPIIAELGYLVWDVRFEKEGACWYLRIFIDKEEGPVNIQDCEKVTDPVSNMLDEEDPIPQSYTLEVSSPGLEADLVRESHFDAGLGSMVRARCIRPINGCREMIGTLTAWDREQITLRTEKRETVIPMSALAFVKLYFEFE